VNPKLIVHSRTAPAFGACQRATAKATAKTTRMPAMIPLAMYAVRNCRRKWKSLDIHRYSMQVKNAESATPTMNKRRNTLCKDGCRLVSNIDRRMRPAPPKTDPKTAKTLKTFSRRRIVGISRPECRRYRSMTREEKKATAVIQHPVTNKGFRKSAPTSDIYAIELSCDEYL